MWPLKIRKDPLNFKGKAPEDFLSYFNLWLRGDLAWTFALEQQVNAFS